MPGQRLGQNLAVGPARHLFAETEVLAFVRGDGFQLVHRGAILLRESLRRARAGGLGRSADAILPNPPAAPPGPPPSIPAGAVSRPSRRHYRRASPRPTASGSAREGRPGPAQSSNRESLRRRSQAESQPLRDLLRGRGRLVASTHASATPTASFRTRAMMPTRSVTLMAPRASSRLNRCEHFST